MLDVRNITVKADKFVVRDISFRIETGQYGVMMGRTGSGKTTLLEAICGLKQVSTGRVHLFGEDITHAQPSLRGIGYVPQDGALFSTMTVAEHLAFALRIRGAPLAEVRTRVTELSELLDIAHLAERTPRGLSGGERQRVALGRALSFRPRMLLLDEPLSAVDEETREGMYGVLKAVQSYTGITALHVTHNTSEATRLADVVFRLTDGRVATESPGGNPLETS